jgi:hypothetical protein
MKRQRIHVREPDAWMYTNTTINRRSAETRQETNPRAKRTDSIINRRSAETGQETNPRAKKADRTINRRSAETGQETNPRAKKTDRTINRRSAGTWHKTNPRAKRTCGDCTGGKQRHGNTISTSMETEGSLCTTPWLDHKTQRNGTCENDVNQRRRIGRHRTVNDIPIIRTNGRTRGHEKSSTARQKGETMASKGHPARIAITTTTDKSTNPIKTFITDTNRHRDGGISINGKAIIIINGNTINRDGSGRWHQREKTCHWKTRLEHNGRMVPIAGR